MKIEVKNLSKRYFKTQAADNVSFEFETGNIFGFIGPNGAGKTTTIKIISTLEEPDSGDVFIDGLSVVNYPDKAREFIGYMPDSLPEYRDIQVWEYLDFFARSFGLKGERRRKMLAEVEEFTNLGEMRTKYLSSLSKGMKQRVSLARALVHDPKVLLLDEPAAGLDPRARMELRFLLKILAKQGKAILISSHILSELQDICDGAVIIERGKILGAGTIDQLSRMSLGEKPATTEGDSSGEAPMQAPPAFETLSLKSLCEAEEVRKCLAEDPRILRMEIVGVKEIKIDISGSEEQIPQVVGRLYEAKLPIVEVIRHRVELEDIFMRVTKGKVQ